MASHMSFSFERAVRMLEELYPSTFPDPSPSTETQEPATIVQKPQTSFLELPTEIRCEVYRNMVSTGAVHSHVGLLLSSKQIYNEAKDELVKYASEYLTRMETRFNARLPLPIGIVMPSKFADLSRITLHLPSQLLAFLQQTEYFGPNGMINLPPYVQLIDRIVLMGYLRSGFPRPSPQSKFHCSVTMGTQRTFTDVHMGIGVLYAPLLGALKCCCKGYSWSLTISTLAGGDGYRLEFIGVLDRE
ncbi:hypothetical protein P171DRAFT_481795 [Karstenula rhodostoma CBS 690.94]|uniref:Uncharacterized protein n=1 Tax=Karstenula rhodostoma CBS 690.94 TaxID=1392251 RepID=A0A9P4UGN9_9PLEO|nr:hypothetical protein P171DRAFT_481795 [Karstenula rhodostoma CBS 690.94]